MFTQVRKNENLRTVQLKFRQEKLSPFPILYKNINIIKVYCLYNHGWYHKRASRRIYSCIYMCNQEICIHDIEVSKYILNRAQKYAMRENIDNQTGIKSRKFFLQETLYEHKKGNIVF